MGYIPAHISARMKHMHQVEGKSNKEIRAWAMAMGYPLCRQSALYHMRGRAHPKQKLSIAHNRELQAAIHAILLEDDERTMPRIKEILLERHNISVSLWAIQKARQLLKWTWGNVRYSTDHILGVVICPAF